MKGQSFRPAKTESFVSIKAPEGQKQTFVGLRVDNVDLSYVVKMKLENGRKSYIRNDKKISSSQLSKDFPVVLFSPESLASIKEGPEHRRALVDEWLTLIDHRHYETIAEFKKVLKSRNKILKAIKNQEGRYEDNRAVLTSLNEIYFVKAARLTYYRVQALKRLLPAFSKALKGIFEGQNVDISVDYLMSSENVWELSEPEILDKLLQRYESLNRAEQDSGTSLVGPHKHDIRFLMNGEDSRYYCSQGQQRALILAFKMAQILEFHKVFNDYPLLLLDDVLSELDRHRRTHLVSFLRQIQSQIFITTTDLSFELKGVRSPEDSGQLAVFEIDSGQIKSSTEYVTEECTTERVH